MPTARSAISLYRHAGVARRFLGLRQSLVGQELREGVKRHFVFMRAHERGDRGAVRIVVSRGPFAPMPNRCGLA